MFVLKKKKKRSILGRRYLGEVLVIAQPYPVAHAAGREGGSDWLGFTSVINVSADLTQDLPVAWQPGGGSGGTGWGVCARA